MSFQLLIAFTIFLLAVLLLYLNVEIALFVLLVLSVFLHKELFSFYRWDILPVRIFMLALFAATLGKSLLSILDRIKDTTITVGDIGELPSFSFVKSSLKDPFIFFLVLLWLVRGVSIIFTKNLYASLTLFAFFTTIVVLGLLLYKILKSDTKKTFKYVKFYIYVAFALCMFAYVQAFIHYKYDFIIGALWYIPGNIPRLGSTFWDVNHFGALLAGLLPILGVLILAEQTWKGRFKYFLMFVSMFVVLLLTNSRTAWIIAFISFISFVCLIFYRKFRAKGIALVFAALVVLFAGFAIEYSDRSSPFRAKVKNYFHYRIDSFDSHLLLLRGTLEIFGKMPILGGGYGSFFEHFSRTDVSAQYFGRDPAALNTRVPAHTIWGELISETGILGLGAFLGLLSVILLLPLYLALTSKSKKEYLISAAMFSSLFGWFAAGVFYSYKSEFFWIIIFLYTLYSIGRLGAKYDFSSVLKYFLDSEKVLLGVLGLLSLFLIFIKLGTNHLIPWDEAIYAKVSKNMVVSGQYLVENWWPGVVWYEKPPLYMWMMAGTMKILGFNSWGARLPSAIFGFFGIFLIYIFGRKLFDKLTGFISGFVLLTTIHYLYYSRASMLDITTTFFITLSLYLYLLAKESKVLKYWVVSGAACGLAVMTKGIIGLLPFMVIGIYEIYLYLSREQVLSKTLMREYSIFLFSSVFTFLPWHVFMYQKFGIEFWNNYIGYHVLERATADIEDKGRPFFWYLIVMRVSMRAWFVVLVGALPFAVFKSFFRRSRKHMFLLIWGLSFYLFFSLAKSKLIWYIIPLYPPLSLMIGNFIRGVFDYVREYVIKRAWFKDVFSFKVIFMYLFLGGGLFYFFLNKNLVYVSDLTGPQAILLQTKDVEFGTDTKIYADRIELPLILFYIDGPFEIVDFGPLQEKLRFHPYYERVVFITKESRFREYKKEHLDLELTAAQNEWVLGYLPSQYDYDKERLEEIERDVNKLEDKIKDAELRGEVVPSEILMQLIGYNQAKEIWMERIERGLATGAVLLEK